MNRRSEPGAFQAMLHSGPGTRPATAPQRLGSQRCVFLARSDVTSLNTLTLSDDETTIERIDTIASGDGTTDPELQATTTAAKERFRLAFETLPRREREVAVLLYVKAAAAAAAAPHHPGPAGPPFAGIAPCSGPWN